LEDGQHLPDAHFKYEDGQLVLHGQYNHIDPLAAQTLPQGFPIPDQAELVDAQPTYWELYVPEDIQTVVNFYTQKLKAQGWTVGATPPPMAGSCGDSDCSSAPSSPAGAELMPAPTWDTRQSQTLDFTTPDGNKVNIRIDPHHSGAIVEVDETLKNLNSAGLPKDLTIFPGAALKSVDPGSAGLEVTADKDTIKNFYIMQLLAAG
jgi:hypothetical protein